MKKCYKCGVTKDKSSFAKNAIRGDGLQSVCRECKKVMDKIYYQGHSLLMRKQINKAKRIRIQQIQDKVFDYLSLHPCVDCGEQDIIVLEFDHERDKVKPVSAMMREGFTWEHIYKEIKKCKVRCANCHRRKTAKAFNYRKYKVSGSLAQLVRATPS